MGEECLKRQMQAPSNRFWFSTEFKGSEQMMLNGFGPSANSYEASPSAGHWPTLSPTYEVKCVWEVLDDTAVDDDRDENMRWMIMKYNLLNRPSSSNFKREQVVRP